MGPWGSEAKLSFKHIYKRLLDSTNDPKAGAYLGQRISLAIQREILATLKISAAGSSMCQYIALLLRGAAEVILNLHLSSECPHELADAKATYKSGEIAEKSTPITLDKIKKKLKESGIFDPHSKSLNDRERKELSKLFEAVEIMTTSRNRQPSNVQNMFSSLRLVERALKKQLKEGQVSETLAAKFHWERLIGRQKREKPMYTLDKTKKMRVFNLNP